MAILSQSFYNSTHERHIMLDSSFTKARFWVLICDKSVWCKLPLISGSQKRVCSPEFTISMTTKICVDLLTVYFEKIFTVRW